MKTLKIIMTAVLSLTLAFFIAFFGFEYAKQKGHDELFVFTQPNDLVIKNARIIDGTGGDVQYSNIGIRKGIIQKVDKDLILGEADLFDATGFTIIPEKVEWPDEIDWIKRDLPSAMKRYALYRIFIDEPTMPDLDGRSVEAVLREGKYTMENLEQRSDIYVLIAPDGDEVKSDSIQAASYKISGWRADALGLKVGKIMPEYEIKAKLYRTREIKEEEFLDYLDNEMLPPADYTLVGSKIYDEKQRKFLEREKPAEPEDTEGQETETGSDAGSAGDDLSDKDAGKN